MSSDNQHSPRHEELLKKQAFERQEVGEVLAFFKKYTKPAVVSILVVCGLVMANGLFRNMRIKKELKADTALMQASSPEALQAIVDDYASTPSGPIALMGLAKHKFNDNQIDQADALYTKFGKKYGKHELASQAKLNLIACKEARKQFGDAHLLYGEFAKKNKGSYLEPVALIGKARCLEALEQLDEAQIAYEDILINFPDTSWSSMAETSLKIILGKKQ